MMSLDGREVGVVTTALPDARTIQLEEPVSLHAESAGQRCSRQISILQLQHIQLANRALEFNLAPSLHVAASIRQY